MSLYSPSQEPPSMSSGEIHIINPTVEEFKTTYLDNDNKTVEVRIAPLETQAYPQAEGQIILRHLMNFVLDNRGFSYKTDAKEALAEIRKECVVYE